MGSPLVERRIDRDVISWSVRCPGVIEANCRLSLYRATRAMRLTIALVKPENREPEGVYVCFPFALDRPTFLLETGGAVFRADIDQLPDTSRDWYSVQHAIGVTDGAHGVIWTTREAPLVQLGAIHTGEWARKLDAPRGHLFAWLMNNLYFTNFRAEQGGRMSFTFDLEPRARSVDADAVRRAGEQAALPIASRPVRSSRSLERLLEVDGTDLVTASLALDPDGRSVRLRLEASSAGAPTVRVRWHGARLLRGWRADVFGTPQDELTGDGRSFALSMNPYEVATLVLAPVNHQDGATDPGLEAAEVNR
jgi:hypothetical protein